MSSNVPVVIPKRARKVIPTHPVGIYLNGRSSEGLGSALAVPLEAASRKRYEHCNTGDAEINDAYP